MNKTVLVWFTNNQRVEDNTVLEAAIKTGNQVIGVYCFNKRVYELNQFGFKKIDRFRAKFIQESITDLKTALKQKNITLFTFYDLPENCIPSICEEFNIKDIYIQQEWTFEELSEFEIVNAALTDVTFIEVYDQFLFHPDDVPMAFSEVPEVFTVFRKICEKKSKVRSTIDIPVLGASNFVDVETKIPSLEDLGFKAFEQPANSAFPHKGGENAAKERLEHYFFKTKKLGFYKKTRNGLVGIDYSSKFSPWLANGSISVRYIYEKVKLFEKEHYKNQSTYWMIFELIWRDYFKFISLKHGTKLFLRDGFKERKYEWQMNHKAISQWINGETGEPFVNANMIELKETGWMSNRGRQNVASYFAKTMKQDWRIGAAYFESLLLDYDVHSNYGNWQYVAGVGNDPRDRIFNVKHQAERYDPNGKFQRTWLQKELF